MPRPIGGPVVFFIIVFAIVAIPASLIGYFELASFSMAGSAVAMFLIGFIIGYVRRWFAEDNVRNLLFAGASIGFITYFTPLRPLPAVLIYAVAYLIGKRTQRSKAKAPYKI